MPYRTNIVYRYDGTFQGFLCCVFQCFAQKELPCAIEPWDAPQETLFPVRAVETVPEEAERVARSIPAKMSPEAYELVRTVFLSCLEEKEQKLLRFLLMGYRLGPKAIKLTGQETVHVLHKAALHLANEAHLLLGFLRFSDFGGFLAAEIAPKNNVLPKIAPHFCSRFSGENFLIWDKVHKLGFVHQKTGEYRFFEADKVDLPQPDETELAYRELWREFYETIAIEGRKNPKLRRTHMPMRYWPEMTEFQQELR